MLTKFRKIVELVEGDCEVLTLHNPEEAYVQAINSQIDLFIVDVVLNSKVADDASGLMFIRNIRSIKRYAFVPTIMISQMEDLTLQTYREFHCYGLIEKPFNMEYAKTMIRDALTFRDSVSPNKKIFIKHEGVVCGIDKERIVYAETINHIIYINTTDKKQFRVRYKTIKRLLDELDDPNIFQCNRNVVVNRKYVENVDSANCIIKLEKNYGNIGIGIAFKDSIRMRFNNEMAW